MVSQNQQSRDALLSRLIEGLLDPNGRFIDQWLPHYEETVQKVTDAIGDEKFGEVVDIIWRQQDNGVSNAGQGTLAGREIQAHEGYFRSVTRDIARDPSPSTFDAVMADFERQRDAGRLSKVPRLLIARAFAAIAPDRYHTTVDIPKHEQVIDWFEKHTPFRATAGNWAHRAAELTLHLSRIPELGDSALVRNMFPWFVFTQLETKHGRPAFTPGHPSRTQAGAGHERAKIGPIVLRHNLLVERLHAELVDKWGPEAVGTEQPSGLGGFVDAVVERSKKRYWIYEVKVAATASAAIRDALGQLLEYAYHAGGWNPEKLFVVGEAEIDAESRKFLARLRDDFALPLEYRRVVAD